MNAPVLNLMIAGAMPSASTQMAHIPAAVRLVTMAMALTVQVKSCCLRHLPLLELISDFAFVCERTVITVSKKNFC